MTNQDNRYKKHNLYIVILYIVVFLTIILLIWEIYNKKYYIIPLSFIIFLHAFITYKNIKKPPTS